MGSIRGIRCYQGLVWGCWGLLGRTGLGRALNPCIGQASRPKTHIRSMRVPLQVVFRSKTVTEHDPRKPLGLERMLVSTSDQGPP